MKSLFHEEWETYTEEAIALERDMRSKIKEIFDMYCGKMGYKTFEVEKIFHDTISGYEAEFRIRRNIRLRKEKKNVV